MKGRRKMSFREKTAWAMMIILIVAGLLYFNRIYKVSMEIGQTAPLIPPFVIAYVGLVVAASVIVMIALAVSAPSEANAPADERERLLEDKAGHWSGYILAIGVITGVLHYSVSGDGNLLAQICFGSLMLSQITEYGLQIWFYRRGGV